MVDIGPILPKGRISKVYTALHMNKKDVQYSYEPITLNLGLHWLYVQKLIEVVAGLHNITYYGSNKYVNPHTWLKSDRAKKLVQRRPIIARVFCARREKSR